ncbi:MAG: AAA family ATPase [Planctomycetes bacterium]|nr:AAA family ATPase [Planctomycetota bacterium]
MSGEACGATLRRRPSALPPAVPPDDAEAAVAVLGSMLLDREVAACVVQLLEPKHFQDSRHGAIYTILAEFQTSGRALDAVLVRDELHRRGLLAQLGGVELIEQIMAAVPTAANGALYAAIVRERYIDREELAAARALVTAGESDDPVGAKWARLRLESAQRQRASLATPGVLGARTQARVRTVAQILDDARSGRIASRPTLVGDLLHVRDVHMLFGPPGLGKSQFALRLAIAVAAGALRVSHILGTEETASFPVTSDEGVPVLVIAAEDDGGDVDLRVVNALAAMRVDATALPLTVVTPAPAEVNLATTRGRQALEAHIAATGAQLVVVDNLTTCCAGLDKSDESAVTAWIEDVVARIRDRFGVTLVLLAHANKGTADGDGRSALDRLFGSMAWGAYVNGATMLDWVPGSNRERRLICAKARGFAAFPTIRVSAPRGDCVFDVLDSAEHGDAPATAASRRAAAKRVYTLEGFRAVLAPVGTWRTRDDLIEALGISGSRLRELLPAWLRALEDDVESETDAGPHGRIRYRLRLPVDDPWTGSAGGA